MNTYIGFLRGINVSGQKKILMADLRELIASEGLAGVQTYIQSGNIIFEAAINSKKCEQLISDVLLKNYGWHVPVLVRTASELRNIFDACPFSEAKKVHSYFTLLHELPSAALLRTTNEYSFPKEDYAITPKCVYFYSETGYGNAKMNNNFLERKLKVQATTRNYKTMVKLLEMASSRLL